MGLVQLVLDFFAPEPATAQDPPPVADAGKRRSIVLASQAFDYVLTRSRRRTIGMLVGPDGLEVRAPRWVSVREIEAAHPHLERSRVIHELGRRIITRFVEDVISESHRRLTKLQPQSAADVRGADWPVVTFSEQMVAADRAMKDFLYPHMYRHPRMMTLRQNAADVVRALFEAFLNDPSKMPSEWTQAARAINGPDVQGEFMRLVRDYIAGMTDRYCLEEHRRLFGHAPELRLSFKGV